MCGVLGTQPGPPPPAWCAPQGSPWCLVPFSCCSPVPTSSPPGPLTSLGFPCAPADTQPSAGAHEHAHTPALACRSGRELSPEKRPCRPPPSTLCGGLLAEGSPPPFPAALPSRFPFFSDRLLCPKGAPQEMPHRGYRNDGLPTVVGSGKIYYPKCLSAWLPEAHRMASALPWGLPFPGSRSAEACVCASPVLRTCLRLLGGGRVPAGDGPPGRGSPGCVLSPQAP